MRAAVPLALLACSLGAATAAADDADSGAFALRGCRIVTVSDGVIENGLVVVRDGRIESVAEYTPEALPAGVRVHDAEGKVLLPAFVHPATRLGLSGSGGGGSATVAGTRRAQDELDPWLDANAWSAANGFATLGLLPGAGIVGGTGVAVRSAAADVDGMVRKEDALLRSDVTPGGRYPSSLSKVLAAARKELDAAEKYELDHAKWEKDKAAAEKAKKPLPKEPPKPKQSDGNAAYRKVLLGETALLCTAPDAASVADIAEALADEAVRGDALRLYVVAEGDAYRAAGDLADLGATCLVRATIVTWPNTLDVVCPATYLRNAGLRVLLLPRGDSRTALRAFPFELARVVAAGFPRDEAWRAVTLGPAELLGLGDEVGAVAKGRRADLMLFSGDPLLATSRLERVWIDGVAVEETP